MDGEALISHDVLARYAADAAREVAGVARPRREPAPGAARRADRRGGAAASRSSCTSASSWGASIPEVGRSVQRRVADYLARMADVRPASVDVVVDEVGRAVKLDSLDRRDARDGSAGLPRLRLVAVARLPRRRQGRWVERVEEEWGAWGTLYRDDDGRPLGRSSTGRRALFPRADDAAGRAAERRRGARHVRLPRRPRGALGAAVALPRGDRRGARPQGRRARGVRLPLSGGRVAVRALPRPPHGLPARLPGRLRLPHRPLRRAASSSRGSSSAACSRSSRAGARDVLRVVKEAFIAGAAGAAATLATS